MIIYLSDVEMLHGVFMVILNSANIGLAFLKDKSVITQSFNRT